MNDFRAVASIVSAHTPGPWFFGTELADHILSGDQKGPVATILKFDGCEVFRDSDPAVFTPIIEANKRLIAAAPEMFEALLMAEDFMAGFSGDEGQEGIDEKIAILQGLIAKVGGHQQ